MAWSDAARAGAGLSSHTDIPTAAASATAECVLLLFVAVALVLLGTCMMRG